MVVIIIIIIHTIYKNTSVTSFVTQWKDFESHLILESALNKWVQILWREIEKQIISLESSLDYYYSNSNEVKCMCTVHAVHK